MEIKTIFKRTMNETITEKNIKTDYMQNFGKSMRFKATVSLKYIHSDIYTICIITLSTPIPFEKDNIIKKFRGVAKLRFDDVYSKEEGEKIAKEKALEKLNIYFKKTIKATKDLIAKFENETVDKILSRIDTYSKER